VQFQRKTPSLTISLLVGLICSFSQSNAQKDSSGFIIFPVLARSIETGWSVGAAGSLTFHFKDREHTARTSNIQAISIYSTHRQLVAALNGSIFFPDEKLILNQQLSYSYFPDKFWGLGKIAPDSLKENYSYHQYYIYLHPQLLLAKSFFLGLLYEYQNVARVKYDSGGLFDTQDVLGRYGYHVSGLGLSLTYDTRNNAFSPDRGILMEFSFNHFAPFFVSDFSYTNFVIDIRKFFRTYNQQVLALQAYGFFNEGEVPLRSLASLGGASEMRGYYAGRYRDKNMYVLQSEYRAPLFWRIGAVAFGGIGNVGPDLKEINFQYLKYSYGLGLRFALNKSEKLNLRIDYGVGGNASSGFYLQIGEAF
jgi:outer membrane protein assembly factor BamA